MSSLAQQLSRLRVAEATSRDLGHNKVASLVFEASEAACMDWDMIHQMGRSAFSSLAEQIPLLAEHHQFLFLSHVRLDRGQLSPAENQTMSGQMKDVLLSLQPYLLMKECQHLLEYLIRNF